MEKYPLRTQFVLTFLLVLFCSLAATLATYTAAVIGFAQLEGKRVYPANFYESQIPRIDAYLQQQGAALLEPSAQARLEQVIPGQGMRYQILDLNGRVIYGSNPQVVLDSRADLYRKLNTTYSAQGGFVHVIPILSAEGEMAGVATLAYRLTPSFASPWDRWWISAIFVIALLSPFIYISLFALLFAQRFARRINQPLNLLTQAAKKIQEKDLDFELDYHAPNELGKLSAAFSEMKSELQKSLVSQWKMEQERVEMVEVLAHDLKTPLSIIHGYVEALLAGELENRPRLIQYLNVIQENAGKSARLVEQMRYASDLERLDFPLEAAPLDLPAFLEQKVENYQLLAGQQSVTVHYQLQDERPTSDLSRVDSAALERILDNTVFNSLRYTPAGGHISITARLTGERIEMEISDNGPGFSKKDLANLFTRFYRGDEARGAKDGHSGLGLYIAHQLTEKLGGAIQARNLEAGGACVRFDVRLG